MPQTNDDLQSVRASLALTAKHLAEAAAPLAITSVPTLGSPPPAAPPEAVPLAKILAGHAEPIAASVPVLTRAVPTLAAPPAGIPAIPAVPAAPAAPAVSAPPPLKAGVPAAGVPPAAAPPR